MQIDLDFSPLFTPTISHTYRILALRGISRQRIPWFYWNCKKIKLFILFLDKSICLCSNEIREVSTFLNKYCITPLFHNLSISKDEYRIHLSYRGQSMSNDDRGTILHELFEWILEISLCLSVKCRSCLIEDKDRSIFKERSCYSKTLSLASWELDSSLSDKGIKPEWEATDEFSYMRLFDDFFEAFFGYIFLSEDDILTDRGIEETIILKYHSNIFPERILCHWSDIDSVDENMSWLDVIESEDETRRSSLPWSCMSDKCDFFPHFDMQWYILQYFTIRFIGKSDIFESDISLHTWEFFRILCFSDFRFCFERIEKFSRCRDTPEKSIQWPHNRFDWREKKSRISDEHDNLADRDESIKIEKWSECDHSDRDNDGRYLRKANDNSPPFQYGILECESLIEEGTQSFHAIISQGKTLHREDIRVGIDIVSRESRIVFFDRFLISKSFGRGPESECSTE